MLLLVFRSNFLSISQLLLFVNNFFIFLSNFLKFAAAVFSGELYNTKPPDKCQQFFPTFLFFYFFAFIRFFLFSTVFPSVSFLSLFSDFLLPFPVPTSSSPGVPHSCFCFAGSFLFIEAADDVLFHRQCFR